MPETHGQCDLPSRKASLLIGWYQIILLVDRGTRVLTTCTGLHSTVGAAGIRTCMGPVDRKSSAPPLRRQATLWCS